MLHYQSLDNLTLQNTWLTIGVFDGVHRGHQEILRQLVDGAHRAGSLALALTFSPHPAVVLGGISDFKSLVTPDERAALLESLGVDGIITQTFDRSLADQTAEEFMRRLVRTIGLRRLIVGYDTALGRGRLGNATRLAEIGKELGYSVQVVSPVMDSGQIISSTSIRKSIAAGDVAVAALHLGRYYSLIGPVIHGDGRGKKFNIPTANIGIPSGKIIPANGVYACYAWEEENKHLAVTNIGFRPTFTPVEFAPHIEAHLLDFNRELYGQAVTLEFVERLRPEQKFQSVEALVAQIHADIERARQVLI